MRIPRYRRTLWAALAAALVASGAARAGEEKLFDSMDDPSAWKTGRSAKHITLSKVAGEAPGESAVAFKVAGGKTFAIAMRTWKPDGSWGDYDGLVFRVKGDGSANFACIRMQAGTWNKAWLGNFPLKDTAWHDVKIAWADFVPSGHSLPELGSAEGHRPSNISLLALGKSWNFNTRHKSPEIAFSVASIKLAKGLTPTRKRVPIAKFPKVADVVRRMKSGKAVTILALGDSITWGTSAGGNANAYPAHVGEMLRKRYGNPGIKIVSAAIGGSTTAKGRQWMMRDVKGTEADLVTVMFGFNEMCRKPADRERMTRGFTANLVTYLEEVAGLMKSPPAAVIIASVPGRSKHWDSLDCYAEGVRGLKAKHPNVTIADAGGRFKKLGQPAYAKLMADEAHPGREGHKEFAKIVFEAITAAGSEKQR